jgi:hypothetical protein
MTTDSPITGYDEMLHGLRVLAVLPPARKERAKYILQLVEAAKKRWDWNVNVMCPDVDRKPFERLVAPEGRIYSRPPQLKLGDWERDSEAVALAVRRLREAELITRLPIGHCILAGAHTVGRAFNAAVRYAPRYAIVRHVLRDNTESVRIVRRLFRFADALLEECRPDLIVAFEWATIVNLMIWIAAQRRGIPCVAVRYSKLNPDHAFWTTDRLMLNVAARNRAVEKRECGASTSEVAHAYLRAFRDKPRVIQYIATKWQYRMQRSFFAWHLGYVRTVAREFINTLKGQDRAMREPSSARLFRYYRALFLSYYHQRFLMSVDEPTLAQMKYVYFPMHKEAELAQTFQATQWYDQRNTIRVLASMLPFGYRLLVREHRFNYGQRPTRFYRQTAQIPNVVLIDPFDSQFKYLRHAELVVTENGSSGWEGLLLGRRVMLLSRTFYDGAGLGVTVSDPERLNATLLETLAKPAVANAEAHDRALGCMIDGELATTFPMRSEPEVLSAALDMFARTVAAKLRSYVAADDSVRTA